MKATISYRDHRKQSLHRPVTPVRSQEELAADAEAARQARAWCARNAITALRRYLDGGKDSDLNAARECCRSLGVEPFGLTTEQLLKKLEEYKP